jgi:hypothetical protein
MNLNVSAKHRSNNNQKGFLFAREKNRDIGENATALSFLAYCQSKHY